MTATKLLNINFSSKIYLKVVEVDINIGMLF